MKAILELSGFQKIIDIPRPEPYLQYHYIHPGKLKICRGAK